MILFYLKLLDYYRKSIVVQVTSYDADVNSTLVYGLEGNYADSFLIDQQTGWISLAKEVDREKVRNETFFLYLIKVTCRKRSNKYEKYQNCVVWHCFNNKKKGLY